jgi:hypothetical protein
LVVLKRWAVVIIAGLLAATPIFAATIPILLYSVNPSGAYSDFCSQANISCAYAWSAHQRLVSTNTQPAQVTRFSDKATLQLSYIGSTFKVDASTLITFCLKNGGTTTVKIYSTQYNDCGWSVIYNQNGTGGDISQISTTHMPPVQIRISDGEPALIQSTTIGPASPPASKYLYATGCTLVTGAIPRSEIIYRDQHRDRHDPALP